MKHIKEIIKKFLGYVGWILAGALILFILVDYKAHSDLAEIYASLDQGTASAADMKKLEFLSSYIKATEDISIMGKINGTWTDTQPGDTPIIDEPGDGSGLNGGDGSSGQVGTTDSYTVEGWKEALAKNNCPYYELNKGYKIETINGVSYLTERQNVGYWKNLGDSDGKSTVDGVGCWLFAMTNAANNLNGTTYSVKDVLEKRNSSDHVSWDSSTNMWISTMKNRGVGHNFYGLSANVAAFDYMGCTVSELQANVGTVKDLHTILSNEGFDNCVYIAYFHTKLTSHGGCHWMAIVGIDEDSIYVLGNGSRGAEIPATAHGWYSEKCDEATVEVTSLHRICPK